MVTLSEIKTYLGIPTLTTTYDTFLTDQEAIISQAIEGYCGRKFSSTGYIQTYYKDDYRQPLKELHTFHFPIISITHVKSKVSDPASEETITTDVRVHKDSGGLFNLKGFFLNGDIVEVSYTAGFATLPAPVKSVLMSLIEERYNKKLNGIALNFGTDVQSISIPGTISVGFDYSLATNERKSAYGTILASYINVLDIYRSERRVVGSGTIGYVS